MARAALCGFVLASVFGCPAEPESNPQVLSALPPEFLGTSGRGSGLAAEVEPNDTLYEAVAAPWGTAMEGVLDASGRDNDVYALGPGSTGDAVHLSLSAPGAGVMLFDEYGRLLTYRPAAQAGVCPCILTVPVYAPAEMLYAVVSSSAGLAAPLGYQLTSALRPGEGDLQPRPQTVVLAFNGAARVRIGGRTEISLPPFDAARIDSRLAGRTGQLIDLLIGSVQTDFAGLGLNIYRDGEQPPDAGPVTTIYFGGDDASLLGLADSVDAYNLVPDQAAIIYVDAFSVFSTLNPTLGEYARVLANVTSHEIGHLVGLRHTADAQDVMDVTASARQMLADQSFRFATLDASVAPFGFQDAPAMLSWALGGQLASPPAARSAPQASTGDDFVIPRRHLSSCGHSGCGLAGSSSS